MLRDRLVAHRGYQQQYPENTLLAIDGAIAVGTQNIELDILFSADGVPVIYHDSNMRRVSAINRDIHQTSASELLQTPAFEPKRFGDQYHTERIAPLSALPPRIQQHPEVTFFVEAKRSGIDFIGIDGALDQLQNILGAVQQNIVLISFNKEFAAAARARGWPSVGVVLESWHDLQLSMLGNINPEYIFCSQRHIPAQASLDMDNASLVIYEVADAELAIKWFRRGADMIETFDIGGLLDALGHRAL